MKTRVISAAVALALVVVLLIFYSTVAFPIAVALIGMVAVFEVFNATKSQTNIPFFVASEIYAAVAPFAARKIIPVDMGIIVLMYFLVAAACMMIGFEHFRARKLFVALVSTTYAVFGLSSVIITLDMEHGMMYFLFAAFCALVNDTGAYFVGSLIGKHNMSPTISPNKTVEGAIGGVVVSLVANVILAYVYASYFTNGMTVKLLPLVICGVIGAIVGIVGDLFASAVKRMYNVKDYGNIMPGHGGIMDRIDSIVFTMPFVMAFVQNFALLA